MTTVMPVAPWLWPRRYGAGVAHWFWARAGAGPWGGARGQAGGGHRAEPPLIKRISATNWWIAMIPDVLESL